MEARLALAERSCRSGVDGCPADSFEPHDLARVGRLHLLAELGECVQIDAEQVVNRRLLEEVEHRVLPVPRNAVGRIVELPAPIPLAAADKIALESRRPCVFAANTVSEMECNMSASSSTAPSDEGPRSPTHRHCLPRCR